MTRKIIDFHTHAFPDTLAQKAMAQLHSELHCEYYGHQPGEFQSFLDGTTGSLLASMDKAGIETSVLCCIATRPKQFEQILSWCKQIRSERIIPFPSVHPDEPQAVQQIERIAQEGFKGVKFHPYYQQFDLDDARMNPIYKSILDNELITVMHTGFDIAFEPVDRAGPQRILNVLDRFAQLRLVTTHMGSWYDWDSVEKYLLGKPIYMDVSVSRQFLGDQRFSQMLLRHPQNYLLFGTDSPWADQREEIRAIQQLNLPETLLNGLFYENAIKLMVS